MAIWFFAFIVGICANGKVALAFDDCPPGVPVALCMEDPCQVIKCPAHPNATCKANYCGGCKADFFENGTKVECQINGSLTTSRVSVSPTTTHEPTVCPPGVGAARCAADPCKMNTCPKYPSAECIANYCGGCNAFYYVNGTKVNCGNQSTTTSRPIVRTQAPCPRGVRTVNCLIDPCQGKDCPRYPDAECVANYCGGCNADFYLNDRKVSCGTIQTQAITKPPKTSCPPGISLASCKVNPCRVIECHAFPNATCKANYCGGCNADFFVNGKKVNCQNFSTRSVTPTTSEPTVCPPGVGAARCAADPCKVNTCPKYPSAECIANYCGGCNAFYYVNGTKVNCGRQSTTTKATARTPALCPPGVTPVQCFADPCTVDTCPRYPDAVCVANYCGGCNADFYLNDRKVSCGKIPTQATAKPPKPTTLCPLDPCQFAKCPRYPNAECRSNYCGGCNAVFYVDSRKVKCDAKPSSEHQ